MTLCIYIYMFIRFSAVFSTERWRGIDEQRAVSPNIGYLLDQVPEFCLASRAKNTQRQYRYAFNSFCKWCKSKNITETLPASEVTVSVYLIHLTNIGKSTSSLNEAFYAISWAHKLAGVLNPCRMDLVNSVKEGSLRSVGHNIVKKEPITPDTLYKIVLMFANESANLKNLRLACMCLLGYAGFLRFSELANIRRSHVFFHDSYIKLFLEASKTDVYREGREVVISKTGNITCPVNMLQRYLISASIDSASDDFIFRPLSFCKSINSFKLRKGQLSYTTARNILLDALESVGLDKKLFGMHSLRSGGASFAAASNVEDRLFKKHGRWKSDKAKDGYIKESIVNRLSVSKNLGI